GKGSVSTLVSTRLIKHYAHIVEDVDRTMLGYELLQMLHKTTEDSPEPEYFTLLEHTFAALDDHTVPLDLVRAWFIARLLALGGHAPNLQTTREGEKLSPDTTYQFDFDATAMTPRDGGPFGVDEIKFLRLLFAQDSATPLAKVTAVEKLVKTSLPLVTTLRQLHLRN
ncbi:DNA repair protein RecO C-terminal domain-containing protein, partial [Candidatus Saccharibacteria bacterium]|nr:DNA repair protein RecO C-terminal domain-containing protein [Candidatus Saccharibacteria bacterium]